jgi:6-phospho-beta-glucosidase
VFCREHPERIHGGATPEVACDHVHRMPEDVAWMRELGLGAYRFSICWTRGLDFYDRLVDELGAAGIVPMATLHHWDLPVALGEAGGWTSRATVDAYADRAEACVRRLGDRVGLWCTLNEPGWSTLHGYVTGLHPPARVRDYAGAVLASHHLMLAHARAASIIRAAGAGAAGIALNLTAVRPATPADASAARLADGLLNRWSSDTVALGRYPADVLQFYDDRGLLPALPSSDLGALAAGTADFLGVNYYYPTYASAHAPDDEVHLDHLGTGRRSTSGLLSVKDVFRLVKRPDAPQTDWGWEIDASGLRDVLVDLAARYPARPLYVTENGVALDDQPAPDGAVHDPARITFLADHLRAIAEARGAGADVRGYFTWSLMDNFSWVNGYRKRYGLLHVDRATLKRTPKDSAAWYRERAASGPAG